MRIRGTFWRSGSAALVVSCSLVLGLAACSSDGSDGAADPPTGDGASTTVAAEGGGDGGEFSVLSYNVAGLPAEVSDEDPEANLPLISPMLEPFDVVLTQEDFDWWKPGSLAEGLDFVNYHERLQADITHEFRTERHPGTEAVGLAEDRLPELQLGDGLAVFSRFELGETERVPWTGCFGGLDTSDGGAADCLAMKGFLLTRITLADGVVVDLYNLHGEAGGSIDDQALQADDYRQLASFMAEQSEGNAVILGGDTNLHNDPPGPDAHEDSADGEDLEIWQRFLDDTGLTDACAATECDDDTRIDKIAFRSGGGVELEATSHQFLGDTFVDDAGEALSDHEPLEVRFRWSAA